MFLLSLVLIWQAAVVHCSPVECPKFYCFVPECKTTVPTYYFKNGIRCEGCPKCAGQHDIQKRRPPGLKCPNLECGLALALDRAAECKVPLVRPEFTFANQTCYGCPVCPESRKKRAQSVQNRCPLFKCVAPGPCSEPLVYSNITINGRVCRACPHCPSTTTTRTTSVVSKRQLPIKPPICPLVSCVYPDCPAENQTISTFQYQGHSCPGCPVCNPTASSS